MKGGIREHGHAICYGCGVELIAPGDGQPYWCTECSMEDEEKYRKTKEYVEEWI